LLAYTNYIIILTHLVVKCKMLKKFRKAIARKLNIKAGIAIGSVLQFEDCIYISRN